MEVGVKSVECGLISVGSSRTIIWNISKSHRKYGAVGRCHVGFLQSPLKTKLESPKWPDYFP